MAKKEWSYKKFVGYIIVNFVLGFGLIGYRYNCMQNNTNSFVSSCCTSDSSSRAIVNAIITLMVFVLSITLTNTACAYRTAQLSKGINEGVYIAIASSDIKYRFKSLLIKRWRFIIFAILFFQYVPGSVTTLSNLAIKTVSIYVKNHSTVDVYNKKSFYNTTGFYISPNIITSLKMISLLRGYSTGSNSYLNEKGVNTNIIRNGFILLTNVTDGDNTNSFLHNETIASATTVCNTTTSNTNLVEHYVKTVINLPPEAEPPSYAPSSQSSEKNVPTTYFPTDLPTDFPTTVGDYVTPTSVYSVTVSDNGLLAVVYDITYSLIFPNILQFNSYLYQLTCKSCNNTSYNTLLYTIDTAIKTVCVTDVILEEQEMIYTLATNNIQKIRNISNETTIDIDNFAQLVTNVSVSIEDSDKNVSSYTDSILGIIINFEPGLFNESFSNYLHSKISSAISLSLYFLWTNYNTFDTNGTLIKGNNVNESSFVTLYNVVIQAYIPIWTSWVFTVVLIGTTILLCVVGMIASYKSLINIKTAVENSFFDNVEYNVIEDRIAHYASNDSDEQLKVSFNKTLYCREDPVYDQEGTLKRLRIKISYDSTGNIPKRNVDYL